MTMPKTIWARKELIGSTKYHSEAALIEMLESLKSVSPEDKQWHEAYCAALDDAIEKARGM